MKIINFLRARCRKWLNEEIWLEDYIKAGLKLGKNVSIQPEVKFDISHAWLIEIGDNVIIAPQAYLLAHDTSTKMKTSYVKIGKIKIGNNCFIGARAFIMPGVEIGAYSIVGAGSVVTKSFPERVVIAGNPAKIVCTVDDYEIKLAQDIENLPQFSREYTLLDGITVKMKQEMVDKIERFGFVK